MTETAGIARLDVAAPRTRPPHLNGGVLRRAALVALILGSVLTLANQARAVFGPENIQLLPLLLVYLTPFVVVTVSQLLGARQAAADNARSRGSGDETFASTAFSHGIPARAGLMGLAAAGVNATIVAMAALLEHGGPGQLPYPLLGQSLVLPMLFGVLSQAIAYRRVITAFRQGAGHDRIPRQALALGQCGSPQA